MRACTVWLYFAMFGAKGKSDSIAEHYLFYQRLKGASFLSEKVVEADPVRILHSVLFSAFEWFGCGCSHRHALALAHASEGSKCKGGIPSLERSGGRRSRSAQAKRGR
jgi:hypothetical protein